MDKNEVCQRINAVMNTLDGGITIRDVASAGNLAGCFTILQETLAFLVNCDIVPIKQVEETGAEQ